MTWGGISFRWSAHQSPKLTRQILCRSLANLTGNNALRFWYFSDMFLPIGTMNPSPHHGKSCVDFTIGSTSWNVLHRGQHRDYAGWLRQNGCVAQRQDASPCVVNLKLTANRKQQAEASCASGTQPPAVGPPRLIYSGFSSCDTVSEASQPVRR